MASRTPQPSKRKIAGFGPDSPRSAAQEHDGGRHLVKVALLGDVLG